MVEPVFSLADLRSRATSREIADKMADGTEIVWCGEQNGEYVGWTDRDIANAKGYEVKRTEEDPALLALVEAVEAAIALPNATRGWRTMSDDATPNVLARALKRFKEAE